MLNLHCFCNSEIYVLVLGVFPSVVWKWRLGSQGRKLAPALAFPPVQVNSSCFALLDLHFTCIFLCYCNTQQLWRVMPACLCGKVAEVHRPLSLVGSNQSRALSFSKEMILLELLTVSTVAKVVLH